MDKFVVRKPRKDIDGQYELSGNESRENDTLLLSSYVDFGSEADISRLDNSVETSAVEDTEEDNDNINNYNSQNTKVTEQTKIKLAKEKCGQSFQESRKQMFHWLFYENDKEKVFCSTCKTASDEGMPLPTSSTQISSFKCFVEIGFNNWKKALEKFCSNEKSDFHRTAAFMLSSKKKRSVSQLIADGHRNEMKENRIALIKLFTSLRLLGRQGLPVRGKVDKESNLMNLRHERADDVVELRNWLKRKSKFKCLSPELTNEILNAFSHGILEQLRNEVLTVNAGYYGIILDETSDVANKEQINFCF